MPTFQEAGFKDLVIEQRTGALVPKRTPAEIVARLNSEINAALRDEKTRKILTERAQDAAGGTPDQYSKLLQSDSDRVARLVKEMYGEFHPISAPSFPPASDVYLSTPSAWAQFRVPIFSDLCRAPDAGRADLFADL